MTRRVIIKRDPYAPLWFLHCAEPCRDLGEGIPRVWCMDMGGEPGCYLGGSLTREGAAQMARVAGYEVVEP